MTLASVVLYYSPEAPTDNTSRIFMRMFLENRSADPLPLASVTVRYWMTSEPAAPRLEHFHTGASISGQSEQFVEAGDDSYVEVAFLGGSVPRGADLSATEFQLQITGGDFDQTDDYSYQPAFAAMRQPHDKITVYLAERLIWGCEPSGTCPSGGSGGAGGEGGGGVAGAAGGDTGEAGAGLGGAGGAP